jgi:hypothetical protein
VAVHDYRFVTEWRVEGTCEEVFSILEHAEDLPRWWGAVYLDVRIVSAGDESGVGRVVSLHTRGWLPYSLRWQLNITDAKRPEGFAFKASGDFDGTGRWRFVQEGPIVYVRFEWMVRADKPLLRYGSVLLKPVFAANHHWAMARGKEGLTRELARRRAG